MDRRYMKSMQTKMKEWYARTKLSALCFAFWKGQFWIATVQQVQAQEMAADDDVPPEDPVQFRVVDLRRIVVREVKKDGRSKPGWGRKHADQFGGLKKLSSQSSQRPHLDNLISIMHLYINWNQQQHPQEVDITVDGSAHSPVIPIPVSSTPASAFISDPPSSAPEVFASPICPPAPSSTPAVITSISDPLFATPEGHVQPSLVFEDIVERKFGSESVYCGNMWQSVLQTCSELNQIQTSKMLRILGKLNEDTEIHTIIRPQIARDILGCMVRLPWEVNLSSSPHSLEHFLKISPHQFISSKNQHRLPE
ncbi:unnamed protein product [Pocillopora meandrina]|uniref:Uncharacterized protein n=1 Tax=Pocillopora meandrina TaxID=46732 RepID=A0AAU9X3K4_9CNID|nr:unnamed protein product [Pocillopora meandrina]